MNTDIIDKAFAELISRRGIHVQLGEPSNIIRQLRFSLKTGRPVSTDLKLKFLHKSGWRPDDLIYSRKDLIDLLKFYKKSSQAAKDHGEEYIIEKWQQTK